MGRFLGISFPWLAAVDALFHTVDLNSVCTLSRILLGATAKAINIARISCPPKEIGNDGGSYGELVLYESLRAAAAAVAAAAAAGSPGACFISAQWQFVSETFPRDPKRK